MDQQGQNGLMATYREAWRKRGISGWVMAVGLTTFYLILYFTNLLDPIANTVFRPIVAATVTTDNIDHWIENAYLKWYLYGLLYCIAMAWGAWYYLKSHGNSRYNRIRITVNLIIQVLLAFSIPFVLKLFNQPDFYFSYLWPLKIEYFYPQEVASLPPYMIIYTFLASMVAMPILAYFYGKRWYCSWVCGCGGLANTFGDPWRHLSDRSTKAWKFEQVAIHTTLIVTLATTAIMIIDFMLHKSAENTWVLHGFALQLKGFYKFVVTSILSGIVGVAVYPLLGPRIWCRNFCPMAAVLGMIQKVGRYRITVKPDMCISCGNCSSYCEMGIDVRSYAQSNESFTRASCVGCGMCAHMCPRGVLRLENVWEEARDKKKQNLPVLDI